MESQVTESSSRAEGTRQGAVETEIPTARGRNSGARTVLGLSNGTRAVNKSQKEMMCCIVVCGRRMVCLCALQLSPCCDAETLLPE